ncbi:MAG: 2,3-bisphosphoglycerate-independent phosphoglycerate mutase [Thermomicrobiales bacterium]|nr:2,3-bisphosphoglycerate-independent phosphoglycerate mutase [Thermomicrobiales bacterium]
MNIPAVSPVVLVILDGWGVGRDEPGNAVLHADTPVMDHLWASYPHATLRTSGEDVGLPAGQMGNSEVGHTNLGAGFVVYQWLTRLDRAIASGEFAANPVLNQAMDRILANGQTLHLLGLVSDGGVHSHSRHLEALLRLAAAKGLPADRVVVHVITDGRDTAPTAGLGYVARLQQALMDTGVGRIGTVSGRYYAMDRDRRWERTRLAYDAMVNGQGPTADSASEAISAAYAAGITDEFIVPTIIAPDAAARMKPEDSVIFFNFRADRGRQLSEALVSEHFSGWERGPRLPGLYLATMARYEESLPAEVAFPPMDVEHPLARVISEAGLAQLHAAETEKYPHVTFFFNGGREAPYAGEERVLVASPKVATYDLQPEMSAAQLTDAVVAAIASGAFNFVIVNFANGDMVGHTGVLPAAIQAVEAVDASLGRIVAATLEQGGSALVTADHGNAEEMIDPHTGGPMTAHTTNQVPVVLVTPEESPLRHAQLRGDGRLAGVAPTVLQLLGVAAPPEMTEPPLLLA